jgi:hypothetical protein
MSETLLVDCGGPFDIEPAHAITCWEDQPLSPAEATLMHYLLAEPEQVRGRRVFHIGIGNSELPKALDGLIGEYVGITISAPELQRFECELASRPGMSGLLMNKHDPRLFSQITGEFDFIVDTLLKSCTCCQKHFDETMDFFASKLAPNGVILTTRNGVNFGWSGTRKRAYTPGSQSDPAVQSSRVLGEEGLKRLAAKLGLSFVEGPTGATGDVVLMLRKA